MLRSHIVAERCKKVTDRAARRRRSLISQSNERHGVVLVSNSYRRIEGPMRLGPVCASQLVAISFLLCDELSRLL